MKSLAEKINKEITMGRVAGTFNHSHMPTLRISPMFLTTKNNEDLRLIHNLSQPAENSVQEGWQRPTLMRFSFIKSVPHQISTS